MQRIFQRWPLFSRSERPEMHDPLGQLSLLEQFVKERFVIRALIGTYTIHVLIQARKASPHRYHSDLLSRLLQTRAQLPPNAMTIGKNQPVALRSREVARGLIERGRRNLPPARHKKPAAHIRNTFQVIIR